MSLLQNSFKYLFFWLEDFGESEEVTLVHIKNDTEAKLMEAFKKISCYMTQGLASYFPRLWDNCSILFNLTLT